MMRSQVHRHNVVSSHTVEEYQRTVNASFVPLQVTAAGTGQFRAVLSSASADDVTFTEVRGSAQLVERTNAEIALGGNDFYKFSLLLAGSSIIAQDGREVVSQPGDLSFYDTSRPYSLMFGGDFKNLILMFPKTRLEFPTQYTDSLTAITLGAQHPITAVIANFLTQAAPHLGDLTGAARSKLAQSSLSLLNTMLAAVLDVSEEYAHPHVALREKIQRYIRQHLSSRSLTPDSIAAAHFISTRHLHALFQESEVSVSTYIRNQRLTRCAQDLLSPVWSQHSISVISHRWGFTDPAHFSRTFRKIYGVSPREYRLSQFVHR